MSKEIVLIYQTDVWHTDASKVLIAVSTTKKKAIKTIAQFVWDKYKALLTEDDEYNLNSINQTQSNPDENDNPFEGEFMLEEIEINKILI